MKALVRAIVIAGALAGTFHEPAAGRTATAGNGRAAVPLTNALEVCNWNRPGVDPFMGDVVAAVDRYPDIPTEVRAKLKARMVKREYDDLVSIRRDSIEGRYAYGSTIREMHFGMNRVCRNVTRAAWTPSMEERGLVYCESGHCILVPTVCRNVSRISRNAERAPPAAAVLLPATPEPDVGTLPEQSPIGFGLLPSEVAEPVMPTPALASFANPIPPFPPLLIGGWRPITHGGEKSAISAISEESNISDATVPPVPEPETWALMLGGLGALAAFMRRRR